jgi:signal transduction histidine kinase/DNA-binding response OmpR family regulator
MQQPESSDKTLDILESTLSGGGEMGRRIRTYDWSRSPLGPIAEWPQSLLTSLSIILNSGQPMFVAWGEEQTFFYNDAYIEALSLSKHPQALGQAFAKVWADIWSDLRPLVNKVFHNAQASFMEDMPLFMQRLGATEETYFSFSYNPIRGELGKVEGLFCACSETTNKVLNERRLKLLGELSTKALLEKTVESACVSIAEVLNNNYADIPFALLYLVEASGKQVKLAQAIHVDHSIDGLSPLVVGLNESEPKPLLCSIAETIQNAQANLISVEDFNCLPLGPANQPIQKAIALPLIAMGQEKPMGVLLAGINPCCRLDMQYQTFHELVARQVATVIQNANAYEEQQRLAEALLEMDRAKTQFFNSVSHEFRTPLTLMLGPLEDSLADEQHPLLPKQKQRQILIYKNTQRLLKLVNSLLDFSRIEAKRMQAVYEPTPLARLTADLASLFRSTLEKAGLEFIVHTPDLVEEVYIDREMYEKIIFNLLSNAFKFTLHDRITVSLQQLAEQVELRVQDTGVGIPEQELKRVFERFHRVEGSNGRSYEGSGIGLALVQELVNLHGGSIQVESQMGLGTTFTVKLPLGKAHLPSERIGARLAHQPGSIGLRFIEEAVRWLPEQDDSLGKSSLSQEVFNLSPLSSANSSSRILLADDNADMRRYVKDLLGQYWQVDAVEDGELALQSALAKPPALILSDVMMPKLDGFGLLKALRQNASTATIPIILLSARVGEEAKIEGLQAGADDYLVKPFSAKELIARIDAQLKMAQLRQEASRREQELQLAAQSINEVLENVLANLKDGFVIFDESYRYVYANASQLKFLAKPKAAVIGKTYWELFPDMVDSPFARAMQQVMDTRQTETMEFYYANHKRWYEVRIYPSLEGISLFTSDVTLRKQLETERIQAIEAAQEKERLRAQEAEAYRKRLEEFIDTVCHEIRNPLNGIYGCVDTLNNVLPEIQTLLQTHGKKLSWDVGNTIKNQLDDLKSIQDNLRACVEQQKIIVDDVLDLSKLENNKLSLHNEPFNPKQSLLNALQMFKLQLTQKGLNVNVDLPEDFYVISDANRFTQVITNILSNAVKFTLQGTITLTMDHQIFNKDMSHIVVHIIDTGIGMSQEELKGLFQPFAQASHKTAWQYGGTGLGLAISKKLTVMMGGNIQVSSEKGYGTDFCIILDLPSAPQPLAASVEATPTLSTSSIVTVKKHILIVEDNIINQKLLANHLKKAGHTYQIAKDGLEGLTAYQQAFANRVPFNVVFMDIEMPVMGGLEATRQIRQYEKQKNLPAVSIIGVSGNARNEQKQMAIEAGMDGYMTKPYYQNELIKQISQVAAPKPLSQPLTSSFFNLKLKVKDEAHYLNSFRQNAAMLITQDYPFSMDYRQQELSIELLQKQANLPTHCCGLILKELKGYLQTVFATFDLKYSEKNNHCLLIQANTQQPVILIHNVLLKAGLVQSINQALQLENRL